jgi:FkbM family methyltransferase
MDWRFVYRGLKARYRDERLEIAALLSGLSAESVAVDVGANKGSYLWPLARAVPKGKVVAFEPQPVLAEYLKQACKSTGFTNVVVEAAGVSARPGKLTLTVPGTGRDSPGASFEQTANLRGPHRQIDVPVVSLDDYFSAEQRTIGAVKIDVEGHELSVLKGGAQLIAIHKPVIVCECEQRHLGGEDMSAVLDFVRSLGYEGFFSDKKRVRPLSEFDPKIHQRQTGERFWNAPDYYNNFIFYPKNNGAAA